MNHLTGACGLATASSSATRHTRADEAEEATTTDMVLPAEIGDGVAELQAPRAAVPDAVVDDATLAAEVYGPALTTGIEASLAGVAPRRRSTMRLGALALFAWAARNSHDKECKRFVGLYAPRGQPSNRFAETQVAVLVLRRFYASQVAEGRWSTQYCHELAKYAARVLDALGNGSEQYPPLQRKMFRVKVIPSHTASLGASDWPELADVAIDERDTRALALVRSAAIESFRNSLVLFEFGQALLQETFPIGSAASDCRQAVRRLLEDVRDRLGQRTPQEAKTISLKVDDYSVDLGSAATWAAAGLPPGSVDRLFPGGMHMTIPTVAALALRCLCTSAESVLAVALVVACDTGLNKQPIFDLARQPITFRTKEAFGLAGRAFLNTYKERAGHEVIACIEDGRALLGISAQRGLAAWNGARRAWVERHGSEGSHALLRLANHTELLQLLEDVGRMADAARGMDASCRMSDRLLTYPAMNANPAAPCASRGIPSKCQVGKGLLQRPGVTFPAIRATFAAIEYRNGRSTIALAGKLGHRPDVAWRNYVPRPKQDPAGQAAAKFFQRVLQALVLPGGSAAMLAIGIDPEEEEAVRRIAEASGLAAAMGHEFAGVRGRSAVLRFDPTIEAMCDVHLVRRACTHARLILPYEIWRVRCLPVFAFATAIRSALVRAGLGREYLAAARRAHRGLADGTVSMPAVWVG